LLRSKAVRVISHLKSDQAMNIITAKQDVKLKRARAATYGVHCLVLRPALDVNFILAVLTPHILCCNMYVLSTGNGRLARACSLP
jgi:hypothetical protein